MIILRQRNYTTVSGTQQTGKGPYRGDRYSSTKRDGVSSFFNLDEEEKDLLGAPTRGGSRYNKKGGRFRSVTRLKDGSLQYNIRHGGELKDEAGRYTVDDMISSRDTSFRDSYRDFLKEESKLYEGQANPQKNRYRSVADKDGKFRKLTNEDIKKDIRRLARKEGMKKWAKNHKGAIIGGTIGATALTAGGIALHRHNKKKKGKKENDNKDKENKSSRR